MKTSDSLKEFGVGKQGKRDLREALDAQVGESIEAFRLALKIAANNPDKDFFKAIWETVSMTNEIHNLTDFRFGLSSIHTWFWKNHFHFVIF